MSQTLRLSAAAAALSLAASGLHAQTATVSAATVGINFFNQDGTPNNTTYNFGAATGGTQISTSGAAATSLGQVNTNGPLSFDNLGVVAETAGGCTVTGGTATVVGSTDAPFASTFFPTQTLNIPLTVVGACTPTPPASLPPGLPCGANQTFLTVAPGTTTSFDLTAAGPFASFVNPLSGDITISLETSPGCVATDETGFTSFTIVAGAPPVPVDLVRFEVRREGTRDVIAWTADNEVDLAGYSVERSADGAAFSEAAFVDARGTEAGTRDYTTTLAAPAAPDGVGAAATYYRLRTLDFDGSEQLSDVVAVRTAGGVKDAPIAAQTYVEAGIGFVVRYVPVGSTEVLAIALDGRVLARVPARVGATIGAELPGGMYVLSARGGEAARSQRVVVW